MMNVLHPPPLLPPSSDARPFGLIFQHSFGLNPLHQQALMNGHSSGLAIRNKMTKRSATVSTLGLSAFFSIPVILLFN
jgi:hypothetical protein